MNEKLLSILSKITEEEHEILNGQESINRTLYYRDDSSSEIDSSRVLQNGKLIDIRPHTRFVHFPKHTHNYVEFIYMVQGTTTHYIDDEKIILQEGDLLLLNQNAVQEILPAGKDDIAVNFMIVPQFFDEAFRMISSEESSIRDFLISCLTSSNQESNYLYFQVKDIIPVHNLLENLIWNLIEQEPNKRNLNEVTMGLLFLSLVNHTDTLKISSRSYNQRITMDLLRYIDTSYTTASLKDFCDEARMDNYTVSRIIKKQTGRTFKQLLEAKRLNQACFLLKNTDLIIEDIAVAVGYENFSFFYRLFRKNYDLTPRDYRLQYKQ